MQTFETQLERLKKASKTVTDTAFASFLGLKQGSISGAKNKGIVPPAWFFQVAEKTGLSIDWLFYGTGSMHKNQEQTAPMAKPVQIEKPPVARASGNEKDNNEWKMRYDTLEKKLEKVEQQRDELAQENRDLWKRLDYLKSDNYELRLALERKGGKEKKYKNPEESFLQYGVPSAAEQRSRED